MQNNRLNSPITCDFATLFPYVSHMGKGCTILSSLAWKMLDL